MSLSIKLANSTCKAACEYCYEHIIRKKGRASRPLDLDAVFAQMDKEWSGKDHGCGLPYLHGGESLTVDFHVLEKVMAKCYELAGRTSIQTYGYLIEQKHIDLFKKYQCSVGISIDGPWPLNKARKVPGEDTEKITEKVHRNMLELKNAEIPVSIICVLHKLNALPEPREKLKEWLIWLQNNGISGGRLNIMQAIGSGERLELSEEEAAEAWRDLGEFVVLENSGMRWQPFQDIVSSLLGLEQGTCIFSRCQYYQACAEPVVFSDGATANCLKTCGPEGHIYPRYSDYNRWERDDRRFGLVRYEVLNKISKEDGGCKGCKYWNNCFGGCPGEAIDNDWRNRTRFCKAYKDLFEFFEEKLQRLIPNIVLSPEADLEETKEVSNMSPHAFSRILNMDRPSSWRGGRTSPPKAKVPVQKDCSGQSNNPYEHIDGDVRHLDSDAVIEKQGPPEDYDPKFEHIDGDVRHIDGGYEHRDSG